MQDTFTSQEVVALVVQQIVERDKILDELQAKLNALHTVMVENLEVINKETAKRMPHALIQPTSEESKAMIRCIDSLAQVNYAVAAQQVMVLGSATAHVDNCVKQYTDGLINMRELMTAMAPSFVLEVQAITIVKNFAALLPSKGN